MDNNRFLIFISLVFVALGGVFASAITPYIFRQYKERNTLTLASLVAFPSATLPIIFYFDYDDFEYIFLAMAAVNFCLGMT